jgi:5'-3' exonuclease
MNKKYLSILANLKKEDITTQNPNDKILLIDGLNTFIRAYTVNPTTNDDGIHIGGIGGFLLSIGYAIKMLKPTRVIICFDGKGGSAKRRKLYPNYKANRRVKKRITRFNSILSREDEKEAMHYQLHRLTEYLEQLPVTVMAPENIEADDAMAYISQQVYPKSQCVIMSSDKDFLQLVDDRVQVWSPTKKKLYFKEDLLEDFNVPSHNFLMYRLLKGDSSDNIPGVKGSGVKTFIKNLPILFEDRKIDVEDILEYTTTNNKSKINQRISKSRDTLELNYALMQLAEVDIHGIAKNEILHIVKEPITRLVKFQFQKMMLEDKLNSSIKNPDLWLRTAFSHLDSMADKRNNDDR